jgi:hypothetical protein
LLASPEILVISENPEAHYRVHKCPPLILSLSQWNPVRLLSYYILNGHFKFILPSMATFFLVSFLQVFLASVSYMLYDLLITSFISSSSSSSSFLVKHANYEAPHYLAASVLL